MEDSDDSLGGNLLNLEKRLRQRRGYYLLEAIDFNDGKLWDVWLDEEVVRYRVKKFGEWQAKEVAFCIPEILKKPKGVFQGVREDGEAHWLCYCGIPSKAYNRYGDREPYPDQVFLVFLNHDRVIYNWRWEKCCPDKRFFPVDYDTRFLKQVL